MKAVLREMFISISAYMKNKIRSQTNSLMMILGPWINRNKPNTKAIDVKKKKKTIKIKAEINKLETKRQ